MTLKAGDVVGPYRITGALGKGGMGEVFRARDEKLQRDVAIKALPAELSDNADAVGRFEREARLLAGLRHQNIAAVYGLEQRDGRLHLVMECVEGETLASRLSRGGLGSHDLLDLMRQVAEGLEAAHRSGIIHRDLKPANIRVTPEGEAKILDFGLARALDKENLTSTVAASFFIGGSEETSPTPGRATTDPDTAPGTLLGTVPYMSPEQARGQELDRRSDIWSFGCVLYECLASRRPFVGETRADLLSSILGEEPNWAALPEDLPPTVALLVRRSLVKDRRRRLQDIGDARVELEHALDDPSSSSFGSAPAVATRRRVKLGSILPWVVGIVGIGLAVFFRLDDRSAAPAGLAAQDANDANQAPVVTRFVLPVPPEEGRRHTWPIQFRLALSPTSRQYVVGLHGDEASYLALGRFDSFETVPIPGTENGVFPFFSADGTRLYFTLRRGWQQKLMRVMLPNGAPEEITDGAYRLGAIGDDDALIVRPGKAGAKASIARLAPGATEPVELVPIDEAAGEIDHVFPQVLPGSRRVLFGVRHHTESGRPPEIRLLDRDTGEVRTLVKGACFGRILPAGFLVYQRENDLLATTIDPVTLEITSEPILCMTDVGASSFNRAVPGFVLSDDGDLAYALSAPEVSTPSWLDRTGRVTPISEKIGPDHYVWAQLSPDGKTLATGIVDDDFLGYLCVIDLARGTRRLLTPRLTSLYRPLWSPTGEAELVYSTTTTTNKVSVFRVSTDGSSPPEPLLDEESRDIATQWSPDGSRLFVNHYGSESTDLHVLHLEDPPRVEPYRATPVRELWGSLSPDGRWLSFTASDNGESHVYVRSFEGDGPDVQVSTSPAETSYWSPDGKTLYFRDDESGSVLAANVEIRDGVPVPGLPAVSFSSDTHYLSARQVHPDGERILVLDRGETDDQRYWYFVLGFAEELKRRFK
jgi:eukaryotic-like serine/threonine-protein kinase